MDESNPYVMGSPDWWARESEIRVEMNRIKRTPDYSRMSEYAAMVWCFGESGAAAIETLSRRGK